ncbi:MAG: DUF5722 domain-containing protein [Chthoniobacter sp.]|uniref:DUF5722 domain-containing protein n=1 Tax=Chthoniobacter sp. TaxID=2510640 RepID=UPI0032A16FF1
MRRRLIGSGVWLVMAAALFAAPDADPYPTPTSKKGLQVQMVDDAIALGIRHAGLNCHLASFVDLAARPDSIRFTFEGNDYFFLAPPVAHLDAEVQPLSAHGIVISLILLNYENKDEALNSIFLHPRYDRAAKTNHMSAFNVATPDGVRHLRATVAFLAQRYSEAGAPHGRVWNYIVGNEVNSHWWWNNMGRATTEDVASEYERAVRNVHAAVRTASDNARIFLSFEHHWSIRYPAGAPDQSCPGRELLEAFARFARERGDFDWHLAYHPYPENLGEPRFWLDKSATQSADTPRITFKNIEILPRYLARPELLWQGHPRHVILSEQGFHCPDRADGERDQAAAYCAAWWKIAHLDGIDAFILHRHVDHAYEGLNLGLWTHQPDTIATPNRHRQLYEVFRVADTPEWEKAFAFALPVIGIERWEQLLPAAGPR